MIHQTNPHSNSILHPPIHILLHQHNRPQPSSQHIQIMEHLAPWLVSVPCSVSELCLACSYFVCHPQSTNHSCLQLALTHKHRLANMESICKYCRLSHTHRIARVDHENQS